MLVEEERGLQIGLDSVEPIREGLARQYKEMLTGIYGILHSEIAAVETRIQSLPELASLEARLDARMEALQARMNRVEQSVETESLKQLLAEETRKSEEAILAVGERLLRQQQELEQQLEQAGARLLEEMERRRTSLLAEVEERCATTLHQMSAQTAELAAGIDRKLDIIEAVQDRAVTATAQKEEAFRQAQEAMQRAQASAQEVSQIRQAAATEAAQAQGRLIVAAQSEIAKVQEQFDRIMRVERIMNALDGAVNRIGAGSTTTEFTTTVAPASRVDTSTATISSISTTQPQPLTAKPTAEIASAPPTVETQPKTAPPTVTASEPATTRLPDALTPGTSAFSFLARFTNYVNIQWSNVLENVQAAVKRNDTRFFNDRRLHELDLILYGDIPTLLNASGEPITEELAAELEQARTQYRQELTQAGMIRIEGKPRDRVTPYWLESDPDKSVPTTERTLDGTYADIVPGNAGYKLGDMTIKPTTARFYKLTPQKS